VSPTGLARTPAGAAVTAAAIHTEPAGATPRTPPQDVAAEQCALGGMLLSKDAIADVVEVLRGHDFYKPAHQTVYDAITDLYGRGEPADAVTVSAELTTRGEIGRIGGAPYLHTLISSVPTAANAGYYAKIVRERAILRRLVEVGTRIVQLAYSNGEADDVVDQAQAEVYAVTERRTRDDYLPIGESLESTLDEIEAIHAHGGTPAGVPTGLTDLDQLTHGLHPGQLIVIAARPGVGKSVLGLQCARTASIKHHLTSCIFSLEMGRNEITMRLLSAESGVPLHSMRSGTMTDQDWTRLARCMGEVSGAPLFIDDSPNMSMMEIRAKCRRLKQRHDLRLVVVDYLQLMSSPRRVENRQQEVSELSRSLKLLAKELDVPVVALSQLNRTPEQRADKRPQLADLRESGSIEADADLVLLIHRDDLYQRDSPRVGEADIHLAKHRAGVCATITAAFLGHTSRFANLASPTSSPPLPVAQVRYPVPDRIASVSGSAAPAERADMTGVSSSSYREEPAPGWESGSLSITPTQEKRGPPVTNKDAPATWPERAR
jgi:replicative DNA helicase